MASAVRPPDAVPFVILTCDLDAADPAEGLPMLTPDEIARADRFVFARDRARFIAGRAFLRRSLGQALGLAPRRVALTSLGRGKPVLVAGSAAGSGAAPGGLQFNLSHADGLAVLALSDRGPVGVDVERAAARSRLAEDLDLLAPRVLCPDEIAALAAAPASGRLALFLAFWTAKEARMKLTGEGLALDPRRIALALGPDGWPRGYRTPAAPPYAPQAQLWPVALPADPAAICHLAHSGMTHTDLVEGAPA